MTEASHIVELVGSIIALLLIAAIILAATKRLKFPFTVALVVVGMGLTWLETISMGTVQEVRGRYEGWNKTVRDLIDQIAEQYPEFVNTMQERLGNRMILHAENDAVEEFEERGKIPHGVAESMKEEIAGALSTLRGYDTTTLRVGPAELLRKVPFFNDIPAEEFEKMAALMRARTVAKYEDIIRQGQVGDSLFLIARGVVRVSRRERGESRDIATLMARDFFGEMALLHQEPRTATVRAVTPCSLYELKREDIGASMKACPSIRLALEEADKRRKAELEELSK